MHKLKHHMLKWAIVVAVMGWIIIVGIPGAARMVTTHVFGQNATAGGGVHIALLGETSEVTELANARAQDQIAQAQHAHSNVIEHPQGDATTGKADFTATVTCKPGRQIIDATISSAQGADPVSHTIDAYAVTTADEQGVREGLDIPKLGTAHAVAQITAANPKLHLEVPIEDLKVENCMGYAEVIKVSRTADVAGTAVEKFVQGRDGAA